MPQNLYITRVNYCQHHNSILNPKLTLMSMSAFTLVVALCLGFLILAVRDVSGVECVTSVSGYTWEFKAGTDEEFTGVQTVDACLKKCNENRLCQGYTWVSTGVVSYCYTFQNLVGYHTCAGCSSGTVSSCNPVACSGNVDDILDQVTAQSNQECAKLCYDTPPFICTAFTYYRSSSLCFLYSYCNDQVPCNDCNTCSKNCIKQDKPDLPYQCSEYMVMDESDRSVRNGGCGYNGGEQCYCDSEDSRYITSPRWQGAGFYRLMSSAGTKLTESYLGEFHCGTAAPGWLRGEHPQDIGVEKTMTVCFVYRDYECYMQSDITVTNCNGYYVYYLPETPSCRMRYCASN